MKTKILIILFVLFLNPLPGLCLNVQVQVDKDSITPADFVSFQVMVEGSSARIDVAAITDFKVDPAGTSTSVSIINGKFEKKTIYQYRLFPLQTGDLVIPPLSVTADGKTAVTQKILVRVSDQAPQHSLDQEIFATASLSGDHVYVGQSLIYQFKLYSTVPFARATLSEPSFAGFEAKQAGERKNYAARVNGRVFNVSEINFVLIPRQEGPFEIEPSIVTAEVVVRDRQDPFGALFPESFFSSSGTRPVRISTESAHGRIDALPPYTGPEPFSGLVGIFDFKASVDKTRLEAGDSATLILRISGTGNVMDSAAPLLALDQTRFRVYDDTPSEEITVTPEGFSGFREFKKALVPTGPGAFEIPSLRLTYFDTKEQQYRTVATDSIPLTVDASAAVLPEGVPGTEASVTLFQKQAVRFEQKDILTIRENLETLHSREPISVLVFWAGLVLPGLLFLGARGILFLRRKEMSCSDRMEKRAAACLKKARTLSPETPEFLTLLYTALVSRILAKENTTGESLTVHEASDILTRAGHPQEDIRQVTEMIEAIESAKFSGTAMSPDAGARLLEKTGRLIKTLSVILVAGLIFISVPAFEARADDKAMTFLEGVRSYHDGEYETAARRFESLAEAGIKNGHLYYNIGNAYLKADDIGRAVLWYERAARMVPNDPDLMFNLEYAAALVKDKKEPEGLALTDVLFFWMRFLPLNGIQAAAILCSFFFFLFAGIQTFRREPVFRVTGVILGLLLLVMSGCALYDYHRQAHVIRAVVIEDGVAIRSGLSEESTRLFELNAGTRVDVRDLTPTHLKIFFSTGKTGWVDRKQVLII